MKNQIKLMLVAVAALALTATSCKKDADENPTPSPAPAPTKTQLLTAKSWRMTSMKVGTMDYIGFLPACQKDDFMTFKTNFTVIDDEGATKCDPSDPQVETSAWSFINNETAIVSESTDTLKILKLTADTLRVETKFETDEGKRETANMTFITVK
ncbi:MAG: hypothetical protein F9K23_04665 [Bacteroidetes bacterium]|nr:MAG: hypothetical protein F9K23_04665 [Bacteroidota bacterium]